MRILVAVLILVVLSVTVAVAAVKDARGCPAVWDALRSEWRWMTDLECSTYLNGGKPPAPASPPPPPAVHHWIAEVTAHIAGRGVVTVNGGIYDDWNKCMALWSGRGELIASLASQYGVHAYDIDLDVSCKQIN